MFCDFFHTSKTDKSIGNSFRLAGGQERKTIYEYHGTIYIVRRRLETNKLPFLCFYFLRVRGIGIFPMVALKKKT